MGRAYCDLGYFLSLANRYLSLLSCPSGYSRSFAFTLNSINGHSDGGVKYPYPPQCLRIVYPLPGDCKYRVYGRFPRYVNSALLERVVLGCSTLRVDCYICIGAVTFPNRGHPLVACDRFCVYTTQLHSACRPAYVFRNNITTGEIRT